MPQRNRRFNFSCEASVMDGFPVSRVSRRQFLVGAGAAGLALAAGPLTGTASASSLRGRCHGRRQARRYARAGPSDVGKRSLPGGDRLLGLAGPFPSSEGMAPSGPAGGGAGRPAHLHRRHQRETVWTYHARFDRLQPGATYEYAVTADNGSRARRAVRRQLHHRPARPAAVPLHELR